MKIVFAIDSFKGSISSLEAGQAAAEGARRVWPDAHCVVRPLADGGEGTIEALALGFGGEIRTTRVTGPLGTIVEAPWCLLPGGTAVIEMAAAAGLTLVPPEKRNPCRTTTRGVGELILAAYEQGARRFIVGIGGSATNDGGAGMLQALGFDLLDATGSPLPPGGTALAKLARLSRARANTLDKCVFRVACDVTNPLCGDQGASAIFGPQKGATPEMVAQLDESLAHFAEVVGEAGHAPGDGAAGGLGYAFRTFLKAQMVRGVELILAETKLAEVIVDADLVVTGEGRLDAQTVLGKAPIGVARLAKKLGKGVLAFSGCVTPEARILNAEGVDAFFPILRTPCTLQEALDPVRTRANLADTAEQVFRVLQLGKRGACN